MDNACGEEVRLSRAQYFPEDKDLIFLRAAVMKHLICILNFVLIEFLYS